MDTEIDSILSTARMYLLLLLAVSCMIVILDFVLLLLSQNYFIEINAVQIYIFLMLCCRKFMTVWRITGKIIRTTIMLITYAYV